TRIGAVTNKLWSKNREGQNGNLAKKSDFIPLSLFSPSLSLSSLSLLRAIGSCDPSPSKGRPGHHRPSRSPPWVPTGPPSRCRHNLTDLNPGAALIGPENRVFRRRFVRSYPNFQLEILLRLSTKSIEHQEPDRIAKETFEGSK
ncbi:hypothetical protein Prudu_018764, partial [Prunus dulcis]